MHLNIKKSQKQHKEIAKNSINLQKKWENSIWIARRLYGSSNSDKDEQKGQMSRPAVVVAILGMAVGIMVMILTVFIVIGFKAEVTKRVVGFGSHIQITNFENNDTFEKQPIEPTDSLMSKIKSIKGIRSVNRFSTKPGMLKTKTAFEGIVFKGVDDNYDWSFFENNLKEGNLPSNTDEAIISLNLAKRMQIHTDSAVLCYFIQESKVRVKRLKISGLYSTDFEEYDKMFLIGKQQIVQQINRWDSTEVTGLEILINDFDKLDYLTEEVYFSCANKSNADGKFYYTQNIKMLNPSIFSWLKLLDMNVVVIIVLMLIVAAFNIVSALLILILENISLIGTLKAMGANNRFIQNIFLTEGMLLITKGLFWGNILALTLTAVQHFTHLIPLDSAAYYVSFVPVSFHLGYWLLLNMGTIILSLLILLLPTTLVAHISPAKVIRYE